MQIISINFWLYVIIISLGLTICDRISILSLEKKTKWRNLILLAASYIFVGHADLRFLGVLLLLTIVVWWCSKEIKRIAIGIIFSITLLGYFKYTNFFIESFSKVFGNDMVALKILLPLGISFYTFSAIGYLVDVQRGKCEIQNFCNVALYLSFFPKITSGPIQGSKAFFENIKVYKKPTIQNFTDGIQIYCFGLFKKIVLADRLSVFVNQVYDVPLAFSSGTIFLAVIAYSLQIYFDFSGYSDMAIGVAKILGIDLPKNFNLPYMSRNVTEFWKRWHITLSSWLQEYLYISLGGNRRGKTRTYINLLLTMVIGGLWHGANWTYIVWGFLHGVALIIHKIWMKKFAGSRVSNNRFTNVISIIGTYLFVSFCWIFFRAESIEKAWMIIRRMVTFKAGIWHPYFWLFIAIIVYLGAIFKAFLFSKNCSSEVSGKVRIEGFYPLQDLTTMKGLVVFFVFAGIIFGLAYTGGSPFIHGAY